MDHWQAQVGRTPDKVAQSVMISHENYNKNKSQLKIMVIAYIKS